MSNGRCVENEAGPILEIHPLLGYRIADENLSVARIALTSGGCSD